MILVSKRGQSNVIGIVIAIALALILMVVLLPQIIKIPSLFSAATSCTNHQGVCTEQYAGCPENYYLQTAYTCSNNQVCCSPNVHKPAELERFTSAQRTALANPIFLTIGDNPNSVTELALEEGQVITATLKFNDKLPEKGFGPVLIYMSDSNSPNQIYAPAIFHRSEVTCVGNPDCMVIGADQQSSPSEGIITGINAGIGSSNFPRSNSKISIDLKPMLKNSYEKRTLHVIILDAQKIACSEKYPPSSDEENWLKCLNQGTELFDAAKYVGNNGLENAKKLISDKSYWLAGKSYKITVKPVLELSGISTSWVAEDSLTVKANKPDYTDLEVSLVNAAEMTGIGQIIDSCTAESSEYRTEFRKSLTNIVGTTTETSGIPLNLNIGGFRIPTATVQLKYITTQNTPKIVGDKADFKIDKATMLKDFYENAGRRMDALFTGQNAYVCIRAKKGTSYAHAISSTPLKVDVLPPVTTQEEIQVIYPELMINTPQLTNQYPSMEGRTSFYSRYPRVVIPCRDYGQSGCASYDYYIKDGNFVNVNMQVDNWQDAVTGIALQYGINQLFNYFASLDPEKTICPYIHSNEFRNNRQSSISVRTKGQAIMCIRIKDNVGNSRLVWKEIYSPQEMLERTAVEAANEAVSAATN